MHSIYGFLSVGFLKELYECEPTVLVVGLIQGHIYADDLPKLREGFFHVNFTHVEH